MTETVFAWVIAATACALLELGSPGLFYALSLSIGAFGAAIAAFYEVDQVNQWVVFSSISCVALLVLYRWVKRTLKKNHLRTNYDALIGKRGIVATDITPQQLGTVKLGGQLWSARSTEGVCTSGTIVEVMAIQGVCLIVKKNISTPSERA